MVMVMGTSLHMRKRQCQCIQGVSKRMARATLRDLTCGADISLPLAGEILPRRPAQQPYFTPFL